MLTRLTLRLPWRAASRPGAFQIGLPPTVTHLTIFSVSEYCEKLQAHPLAVCMPTPPEASRPLAELSGLEGNSSLKTLVLNGVTLYLRQLQVLSSLEALRLFSCTVVGPDGPLNEAVGVAICFRPFRTASVALSSLQPCSLAGPAENLTTAPLAGRSHAPCLLQLTMGHTHCPGLGPVGLIAHFPVDSLTALASKGEGDELAAAFAAAAHLTSLRTLRLMQAAPRDRRARFMHQLEDLNVLSQLTSLRELSLQLHYSFFAPSVTRSHGSVAQDGGRAIVRPLAHLSHLTALSVGEVIDAVDLRVGEGYLLGNRDVAVISGLQCLRHLRLSGAGFSSAPGTEPNLGCLRRLRRLRTLSLDCCHLVGDAECAALAAALPELVGLDLSYCQRVTQAGLRHICAAMKGLRLLRLTGCHVHVHDQGLMNGLRPAMALRHLGVSFCHLLTPTGVAELTAWLPELRILECSSCDTLTLDALRTALSLAAAEAGAWCGREVVAAADGGAARAPVPCACGGHKRRVLQVFRDRLHAMSLTHWPIGDDVSADTLDKQSLMSMLHDHCCQGSVGDTLSL